MTLKSKVLRRRPWSGGCFPRARAAQCPLAAEPEQARATQAQKALAAAFPPGASGDGAPGVAARLQAWGEGLPRRRAAIEVDRGGAASPPGLVV